MQTDKLFYKLFQLTPELARELVGLPPPELKGFGFGAAHEPLVNAWPCGGYRLA